MTKWRECNKCGKRITFVDKEDGGFIPVERHTCEEKDET